MLSDLDRIK